MIGGLAVQNNLLCVTWSAGRGHVFLYDLDASERVSSWTTPEGVTGYSDAGGVAIDRHFRIFVADPHNGCVRRYNAFGQHLGDLGLPAPSTGDRGRDRLGVLEYPHSVANYLDVVYVASGERPRRRAVQCFHVDGAVRSSVPARGLAEEKWGAPRGIWADASGLVVADTLRGRLQCFRHNGAFVREFVLSGELGPMRPASLLRLRDGTCLFVDHAGTRSELRAIRADGTDLPLAGLAPHCRDPLAITVDAQQRVFVLDHDGERVVRATKDLQFEHVLVDLVEHDRDAPGSGPQS